MEDVWKNLQLTGIRLERATAFGENVVSEENYYDQYLGEERGTAALGLTLAALPNDPLYGYALTFIDPDVN